MGAVSIGRRTGPRTRDGAGGGEGGAWIGIHLVSNTSLSTGTSLMSVMVLGTMMVFGTWMTLVSYVTLGRCSFTSRVSYWGNLSENSFKNSGCAVEFK